LSLEIEEEIENFHFGYDIAISHTRTQKWSQKV